MVTPIHIITVGLGVAFALGLFSKLNIEIKGLLMLLALGFMTFISAQWFWAYMTGVHVDPIIFTAGFKPPVSINLQMGVSEALFTMMINLLGFLSGIFLWDKLKSLGKNAMSVLVILFMGLNVIILTRDLFNLFVFLEIVGIATAGLIVMEQKRDNIAAGFKYMMATGIIAGVLLLGTIFAYYYSSSLNLDDIIGANIGVIKGGAIAAFLILIAILLELKPFPANGWALDVYQAANPGLSAILSAGSATAALFVLIKVLPIAPEPWLFPIAVVGILTFFFSNMMGINQQKTRRMLGYSSVAQIGLLLFILGFLKDTPANINFIFLTILGTHFFAKAGLFWLSGIVGKEDNSAWSVIRNRPVLILFAAIFIFALLGFPPFPSFFGKWQLIMELGNQQSYLWIILILVGSIFEAYYLLRWFGKMVRGENRSEETINVNYKKLIPIIVFGAGLLITSWVSMDFMGYNNLLLILPLALVLLFFVIDNIDSRIKNLILIVALGYYTYDYVLNHLWPDQDILRLVFSAIFLVGGLLFLIPGFSYKGKRMGMYPMLTLMFAGLAGLLRAETLLEFFIAWEFMTIGSYMLVLRGKESRKPAFSFILFSLLGAFMMLAGFGLVSGGDLTAPISILQQGSGVVFLLVAAGFLVKIATIGLHIWLPGSYAVADDDVTPIISAILIKSGVFGLIILMLNSKTFSINGIDIPYLLGWIGAITALLGNVMAVFQEDVKKLLAYSSVGVLGFILFSFAMMTHLGWLTGITYSAVHFLYKGLLFIAIAGVIYRTKTRKIYEMGGLIKKMPLSFIAVLIGIITLAGMPPLAGFAGKWMLYNAVITNGWYIQGAIAIFAGIVAFLYCFKLIHNIFLGPIKDNLRKVKEAPAYIIIPQLVLIGVIMFLSYQPKYFLEPVGNWIATVIPGERLVWDGNTASTSLGYWNPTSIMIIVMGLFAVLLGSLWLMSRKVQKVEMFNIVYQAEQPDRPETTHYAFNMFAHYNKALGFLVMPLAAGFWNWSTGVVTAIGGQIRKIYSGNGQAYALHMVIFIVLFYLLTKGGF